jgi:hypothetical protein
MDNNSLIWGLTSIWLDFKNDRSIRVWKRRMELINRITWGKPNEKCRKLMSRLDKYCKKENFY